MFNADFATVKKRVNSTLIPDMSEGETIPIELREPTSIINPVIILSHQDPTRYNYCRLSMFDRYYFITDWTADHNMWQATLQVDVLASYRSEIRASYEYVLRSASLHNGTIVDSYYPTTTHKKQNRLEPLETLKLSGGALRHYPLKEGDSYIVGVYGLFGPETFGSTSDYAKYIKNNTRGGITYYWFTRGELTALILYLTSNNSISDMYNFADISDGLKKVLINPLQYISSIIEIPIDRPENLDSFVQVNNIVYGWYAINYEDINLSDYFTLAPVGLYTEGCSFDFRGLYGPGINTIHPQGRRGVYLNTNPYTKVKIIFEPFGEIPIDMSLCPYAIGLRLNIQFEPIQGLAILDIYPYKEGDEGGVLVAEVDTAVNLYHTESQIGIPVSINQLAVDNLQTMNGLIGTSISAASKITSADIPGAIESISSGVESAVKSQFPQNQKVGIAGTSLHRWVDGPFCYIEATFVVNEDEDQLGRPLCSTVQLGTLSGFCMTRDADISITGTQQECDTIKTYLNNGFFLE